MTNFNWRRHERRAHSLTELVIAMPLVAMLMVGLVSAIHIAGQAIPDSSSGPSEALAVQSALTRMVDDLRHAQAVTTQTSSEITVQVPDRDGDNAVETIRYSWSGSPGAPILCQLNALAPEQRITNVGQFVLSYTTSSATEGAVAVHRLRLIDVRVRKTTSFADYLASTTVPCQPAVSAPASADGAGGVETP